MDGISDIRIAGFDGMRPPRILKEPYINLFFKLTCQAPKLWCEDFNHLVANAEYPIKIDPAEGLFIETWVRKADEIESVLDFLKGMIQKCIANFIARAESEMATGAAAGKNTSSETEGEQGRLNEIIAKLNFDA